jgi:competence protein ComEC
MLLLVNPFNLWDVGFQLSFAALVSIAILSKPITSLLSFNNFILQNIWQLVAVTIAAQALTLPLVIYHFHQFPLSFILSNLIAVPLSSIILYALILLLFISWFHLPAVVVGWFCFYAIKAMNVFIGWVASLSFSRI